MEKKKSGSGSKLLLCTFSLLVSIPNFNFSRYSSIIFFYYYVMQHILFPNDPKGELH